MTGRLLDYAAPVLRAARNHASLSQAEIAQRAGVSDATISRTQYLRCRGTPFCAAQNKGDRETGPKNLGS